MFLTENVSAFRRNGKFPFPPHGKVVARLPDKHHILWTRGIKYFIHAGIFYRGSGPEGFVVVAAPVGAVVKILPPGLTTIALGSVNYYYYGGAYYRKAPNGYVVVEFPQELVVVQTPTNITQHHAAVGESVTVTAHALNVRSGPGKNHPVLQQVYNTNILIVLGNAPDWFYVKLPSGKSGWVMSKFTAKMNPPANG